MDLLNQLKTLRDNTTNPEVKSVCESHIRKIQNGEVLNESAVMESVGQTVKETEGTTINPLEMIRKQELEASKNAAQKLMESWSGVGSKTSKTSGSYVDGKTEEKDLRIEPISESLKELIEKDPSAKAFMNSQGVNNLGVFESILSLKGTGIYEHPNVKILCEKYVHLLKNNNLPEYLVAESFVTEFQNFSWDSKVKNLIESIGNKISGLKPEIEVSKALYSIEKSAGSDFYSPVTESLNKWLVSENKSVAMLSKDLARWSFNPTVKNLVNTLSLMESTESKLAIPVHNGNSSVRRVFSPVHVAGGKTVFSIGNNIFEGDSEGIRKISKAQYDVLPVDFKSLLEAFYSPMVKVNENGLSFFVGNHTYKLVEENDSVSIYTNGTKLQFSDLNQLAKQVGLEISGSFGVNESKAVSDLINVYTNFDKIVELDFAKRLESKVYEGASVNIIKWNNQLYLNRINNAMNENSLYKVNGTQASSMVKEFLKYDISEGLTEFLEGETKIKSIMINDRKQILENISVIENEINKLDTLMTTNPLYNNSKEMQRAKMMLEQELSSLRKKWSAVNEEIEKIDSSSEEIQNVNEDEKFQVGDYVKVKESGNTGKIISVDSTSGSYTVLMDNGRTGDFRMDEIVDIEEALNNAGEENQEDDQSQEEVKENEMAIAPSKETKDSVDKTPAATLKANTSAAPTGKDQDTPGKKDIEKEEHANLEEAPEGSQKETNYEIKIKDSLVDKVGYNVNEENDEEVGDAEISEGDIEKNSQELAEAPGGRSKANYDLKVAQGEEKNPEIMKTDAALASAPGDGQGMKKHNEVGTEMGYNLDEASEIEKTNQQLAVAPGGTKEIDYAVKVTQGDENKPDVMNIDPALAIAPDAGAKADTDIEVNHEMGYNLDEAIEFLKNNKDSKEVQDFLKTLSGAISNETAIDESEESKKN